MFVSRTVVSVICSGGSVNCDEKCDCYCEPLEIVHDFGPFLHSPIAGGIVMTNGETPAAKPHVYDVVHDGEPLLTIGAATANRRAICRHFAALI